MRILYPKLLIILAVAGGAALLFGVGGCEKKERLTVSTFDLTITPPAVTVVKGETQVLRAQGVGPGGAASVSPIWQVSSSAGQLNTTIGPVVTFTAASLGDVTVTATLDEFQGTSEIAIVTYQPGASTFDIYSDNGLPTGDDVDSDIFVDAGVVLNELSTGYTPEGIKYQATTNANANQFWGVTLDDAGSLPGKNLSDFTTGNLKFSLRLKRALGAAERLTINVEDNDGTIVGVDSDSFTGYDRQSLDWQEVSVGLNDYFSNPLLDETAIVVPFAIVMPAGLNPALSFDVDAIRWEK